MGMERPDWAKNMIDPPFTKRYFTAEMQHKVLHRTGDSKRKLPFLLSAVSIPLVLAAFVIGWFQFKDDLYLSDKPTTRNALDAQGRQLFTVYQEPHAEAGKTVGYMLHFEEPFETYFGRKLTLQAVHLQSGANENLSSEVITEPSPGYSGLDRYTVEFILPLEGMWNLNVLLDDKPYGNVQLLMLEPSWDITPEFQSGAYMMRGVENKVGFIDAGFIAGRAQKYMWHFWGIDDLLNGPFEVKAVKQGADKIIEIYSSNRASSANALAVELNGADRHIVTSMKLPEAGRWRLLPYVKGRLLETIVVEIN